MLLNPFCVHLYWCPVMVNTLFPVISGKILKFREKAVSLICSQKHDPNSGFRFQYLSRFLPINICNGRLQWER